MCFGGGGSKSNSSSAANGSASAAQPSISDTTGEPLPPESPTKIKTNPYGRRMGRDPGPTGTMMTRPPAASPYKVMS